MNTVRSTLMVEAGVKEAKDFLDELEPLLSSPALSGLKPYLETADDSEADKSSEAACEEL